MVLVNFWRTPASMRRSFTRGAAIVSGPTPVRTGRARAVPRSAAPERYTGQGSAVDVGLHVTAVQQDRHLSLRRNGFDFRVLQAKRTGFGAFGAGRENLHRTVFPRGAVENGFAIGRKARQANAAMTERELVIDRWNFRLRGCGEAP